MTHCHWFLHYSFIFASAVFHKNAKAHIEIGFSLHDKLRIQFRLKSTYDPIVWQCLFDYHFCNKSIIFTRSSSQCRWGRACRCDSFSFFILNHRSYHLNRSFDLFDIDWWMLPECSNLFTYSWHHHRCTHFTSFKVKSFCANFFVLNNHRSIRLCGANAMLRAGFFSSCLCWCSWIIVRMTSYWVYYFKCTRSTLRWELREE